ncbi:MAG: PEGA domain-containing protein [Deltaproteobacteria bacterium]|nr:PEGA domain-containing protein [Deltaproteobacteria bacterium]
MVRRSAKAGAGERVLHVSTKCRSVDELLSRFAPFATADSLTVPAREGIAVGERLMMRVTLADSKEVFSARGEVVELKPASQSAADRRPVVRVRLLEMDEDSQALFLSLSRKAGANAAPVFNDERTVVPTGVEDTEQNQPAVPSFTRPTGSKPVFGQPKSFVAKGTLPVPPPRREVPTRRPPTPPPERSRSSVPTAQPSAPAWAPRAQVAAPAPEPTRTAGSEYKLPANPLAELNIDAVKSFVDCNLYESDGFVPPPDEVTRRAEAPAGITNTEEVDDENLELLRASALGARDELTDIPSPPSGWRRRWADLQRLIEKLPAPLRRTLVQAIPFAFCTLLGWCVGFNMAGLPAPGRLSPVSPVAETPPAVAVVSTEAANKVAPHPTPVAPPSVAPPPAGVTEAPAAERVKGPPAPPVAVPANDRPHIEPVASGADCVAKIDVRPAGVAVKWAARDLGIAPLASAAVPCGPARVVFERERWETVTRQVDAKPGVPVDLLVKMNRPPSYLTVTTTPAGANIEINGIAAGKTPRKVPLRRYETVKVDLRLEGHRSWHTEVYLKALSESFNAQLDPLPKPKVAKPAAPK